MLAGAASNGFVLPDWDCFKLQLERKISDAIKKNDKCFIVLFLFQLNAIIFGKTAQKIFKFENLISLAYQCSSRTMYYAELFRPIIVFLKLARTIPANSLICCIISMIFATFRNCSNTKTSELGKFSLSFYKTNRSLKVILTLNIYYKTPRKLLRWISHAPCSRKASKWAFVP